MQFLKYAVSLVLIGMSQGLADPSELSLRLTALDPIVKSGSRILISASVMNKSSREITYHNTNFCDYRVSVQTSSGVSAPETPLKKGIDCSGGTLQVTGRDIVVTLKPGESNTEEVSVTARYDMSAPGRYSVQVDRNFPQIGKVESNVVDVTVTP